MDYSRLIPETAPEDLFACIEKECERFRKQARKLYFLCTAFTVS